MMIWLKNLTILRLLVLAIQIKEADCNTKISKIEKKVTEHDHGNQYVTNQEFNRITANNFADRLEQANLACKNNIANFVKKKTYFDEKLKNYKK